MNQLQFNRKAFIKGFKKKINQSIFSCKLYSPRTDETLAEANFKRITEILNASLQRKDLFDSNNIIIVIARVGNFFEFISEFANSVKDVNDDETLRDRHIAFFTKQGELEKFLNENFSNPGTLDESVMKELNFLNDEDGNKKV